MNVVARMIGAARLDSNTYEDVEQDSGAMVQALLVVVAVAIFTGVGQVLRDDENIVSAVLFGAARGVGLWAIWALVAWMIGSTILRTPATHADWGQLARGTGFAQTPGLLSIFVFLPAAGAFIPFVVFIWQLFGMVIALRQTLDYTSAWRAFFVVVLSLIPVGILYVILLIVLGIADPTAAESAHGG